MTERDALLAGFLGQAVIVTVTAVGEADWASMREFEFEGTLVQLPNGAGYGIQLPDGGIQGWDLPDEGMVVERLSDRISWHYADRPGPSITVRLADS